MTHIYTHAVPTNDIIPHICAMCCECIPYVDEQEPTLIVHNRVGIILKRPTYPSNCDDPR
jgi:hypothetical protein